MANTGHQSDQYSSQQQKTYSGHVLIQTEGVRVGFSPPGHYLYPKPRYRGVFQKSKYSMSLSSFSSHSLSSYRSELDLSNVFNFSLFKSSYTHAARWRSSFSASALVPTLMSTFTSTPTPMHKPKPMPMHHKGNRRLAQSVTASACG